MTLKVVKITNQTLKDVWVEVVDHVWEDKTTLVQDSKGFQFTVFDTDIVDALEVPAGRDHG